MRDSLPSKSTILNPSNERVVEFQYDICEKKENRYLTRLKSAQEIQEFPKLYKAITIESFLY